MKDEIKAPYFDGSQPCAQIGGDFFFADSETDSGSMIVDTKFLKKVCESCHFKNPCLEYAVTHEVEGYWAGTGARQRHEMRKKLGIKVIEYEYMIKRNTRRDKPKSYCLSHSILGESCDCVPSQE